MRDDQGYVSTRLGRDRLRAGALRLSRRPRGARRASAATAGIVGGVSAGGLPIATSPRPLPEPQPPAAVSAQRYGELARRVKLLSWLSLGAMSVEGFVAVLAGVMAGSVALVGFGLDSAIEGFASVIIIWRFTGS